MPWSIELSGRKVYVPEMRVPTATMRLEMRGRCLGMSSDVPLRYRVASLVRNSRPLGPCSRHVPRALW